MGISRALTDAEIARVARALKPERLDKRVTPVLEDGIAKWGAATLDELGASAAFDMRNPLVDEYLDAWREQKLDGVTRTTRDQVTALLQNAAAEGVGIDEVKRRLRETFEGWTSTKAETVARTEVVGASNAANLAAYQISGLVDEKEWLAVQDDATRESHSAMDGQRRKVQDAFDSPEGYSAQGPGLFGIGSEDINCRCTVRPIVDTKSADDRVAMWKRYDAALAPFEKKILNGAALAIGDWLGDAITALG